MNSKVYNFQVGQKATLKKIFTENDVRQFAELSGDFNPIHLDKEYASNSIFRQRIVHGFLYGSLISAVLGNELPGHGSIYLHQEMNFKKPLFLNEEVIAVVTIEKIDFDKSLIYLSTNCYKEGDVLILEGKAIIKLI